MASKGQLASRLLSLPAELRNNIYWFALVSSTPVVASTGRRQSCAALLRTCHQIRDEATQIFYTNNTFREQLELYYLNRSPRNFNRKNFRLVEHFEVQVPSLTAKNLCLFSGHRDLVRLLRGYIVGLLQAGIRMESIQLLVQQPVGLHWLERQLELAWEEAKAAVFALARGQIDDDYTDQSLIGVVRDAMRTDDDMRRRGLIVW